MPTIKALCAAARDVAKCTSDTNALFVLQCKLAANEPGYATQDEKDAYNVVFGVSEKHPGRTADELLKYVLEGYLQEGLELARKEMKEYTNA